MTKIIHILGAPGTGKTTYIAKKLSEMDDVSQIVALSFTRAAKYALLAKERRLNKDQVKTIHSMAYSSLMLQNDNILMGKSIATFFRENGLPHSGHQSKPDQREQSLPGNRAEMAMSLAIHTAPKFYKGDHEQAVFDALRATYDAKKTKLFLPYSIMEKLTQKWIAYNIELNKFSYDMLLFMAWIHGMSITGSLLILDEAQDLTPLMIALLKPNFGNFDKIMIVGDDDQAIFNFAGSSPDFFVSLKSSEKITLSKSWRLSEEIHALSQRYIVLNENRLPKKFSSNKKQGQILETTDIFSALRLAQRAGKTTLILSRMRHRADAIMQELRASGIILQSLSDDVILPRKRLQNILNGFYAIEKNEALKIHEWRAIVDSLALRELKIRKVRSPKKVVRDLFSTEATIDQIIKKDLSIEIFCNWLKTIPFEAFKDSKQLSHWWSVWRGRDNNPRVPLKVGTIHQSKGLQTDTVILDGQLSPRLIENFKSEDERRVTYVAITRAKTTLILVNNENTELKSLIKS